MSEDEQADQPAEGEQAPESQLRPGVDFIPTPEPTEGGVEPRPHPNSYEFVPTPEPSEPT